MDENNNFEGFEKELILFGSSEEDSLKEFCELVKANYIGENCFMHKGNKWMIIFDNFGNSDDIIVEDKNVDKYDFFLLIKSGDNKIRVAGWTDKKKLLSTPARDIYRNNKKFYMVAGANIYNLSRFKIPIKKHLLEKFVINKQKAENQGHTEMISGILAGLHFFAKEAKVYFKDINQQDECVIGDKKVKVYTRDMMSDEDMLIYETYYKKHPEIDLYICCKIRGSSYEYLGYVSEKVVDKTRVVQMIDKESTQASSDIRRIFAEQYKPMSDLLPVYNTEQEKEEEISEQQSYVPIHMHSEFSVGDAFGHIKDICKSLRLKGFKGAALTDHGTMAGVWEFQKQCLLNNLKPIIGIEAYVAAEEKGKKNHMCLYVKNKIGWLNLLKLNEEAVRKGFYYKPTMLLQSILDNSEGLMVTTGCMSGKLSVLVREKKIGEAKQLLQKLKNSFGDDLYIEIHLHDIEGNQAVMENIYGLSKELNIKCVLATDTHYIEREDKKVHDAVKAISFKKNYGEAGYGDDCFFMMQDKDVEQKINDCGRWMLPYYKEFMKNTFEILDKADFMIKAPKVDTDNLPEIDTGELTSEEEIRRLTLEGLEKKTKYKYEGDIKDRIELEFERIIGKNYTNYFLIVADFVKWAKSNDIAVGPGRGSVGASLVAYCLDITDVDPIEHDLLFDRFLSEIRRDCVDIDLDFEDRKRNKIYKYLIDTYGEDHCARVVTYSRFHVKGILRDIGRIFKIPIAEINKICGMVIERSGGDARASFGLEDTFEEFSEAKKFKDKYPLASEIAMRLEGHIRHKGVHAAAMVVSRKPTSQYLPINKVNGIVVTEWEKQLVEDIKLIKFDILGLKTLSVINDCVKSSGCKLPTDFNDPKVYKNVFKKDNMLGIFQFGTTSMGKFAHRLQVETFNELYDATTLFRPGALHSGQAMIYYNRKFGKEKVEYMHQTLEPITKTTRGIILYQEQIMQIMNQIGGMSWATAEMARKVITKSKGADAFNKMRKEFVTNANKFHKMPIEEAERLYDVVSTFGNYSFNKSHAVEYSQISYHCAWLKTYYPKHFFKSLLKFESDSINIQKFIQDAEQNGVSVEFPHINKSKMSYEMVDDKIYAGFDSVVGIGKRTADKIIDHQPYTSLEDFKKRSKVSKKLFTGLLVAEAFRVFGVNKKQEILETEVREDFSDIEQAQLIYKYTTLNPKIDITKSFDFGDFNFVNIADLNEDEHNGKQVFVRGIITASVNKDKLLRDNLKDHHFTFEKRLTYLNMDDGSGNIAIQVSPATYEKYQNIIIDIEGKPVVVLGIVRGNAKKIMCDMIQIVCGENKSGEIEKIFRDEGNIYITSAQPAVSKNKNSYYRIKLSNGVEGLCFRFNEKFFPGMKVNYEINKSPFINIDIVKEGNKNGS